MDEIKKHFLKELEKVIVDHIPFHKHLGLKIESMDLNHLRVRLDMKKELIGNFVRGTMHGGVIATVLDLVGGIITLQAILRSLDEVDEQILVERFSKIGTIDLRVDYLLPGRGDYFIAEGNILRIGNKVSVCRMEMQNDKGIMIAAATGSYLIN